MNLSGHNGLKTMKIVTTWTNNNPNTIYNKLKAKLQREPTIDEIKAELTRIIREARQ